MTNSLDNITENLWRILGGVGVTFWMGVTSFSYVKLVSDAETFLTVAVASSTVLLTGFSLAVLSSLGWIRWTGPPVFRQLSNAGQTTVGYIILFIISFALGWAHVMTAFSAATLVSDKPSVALRVALGILIGVAAVSPQIAKFLSRR